MPDASDRYYLGSEGDIVPIVVTPVLGGTLLLTSAAEEGHSVGDHLNTMALDILLVDPVGVVDAAPDHDLLALLGIVSDGLGDAVEAGDAAPFCVLDAAVVAVLEDLAFTVALRARSREAEVGDLGAALGRAGFGGGSDVASEDDEVPFLLRWRVRSLD